MGSDLVKPDDALTTGSIDVEPNFARGIVTLTIKRPLEIEPIKVDVAILDYIEAGALMTQELCRLQKEMALRLKNGILPFAKKA